MTKKLIVLSMVALAAAGCNRSKPYKQTQEYYQDEAGSYYYGEGAPQNKTERAKLIAQPKNRVMILDFWNDTPVRDDTLGSFGANELRREVYLTNKVILPPDIQTAMTTKEFVEGAKVRMDQLIREGRRAGVVMIILGRVSQVVFRHKGDEVGLFRQHESLAAVDIELKIYDVQGGRELAAFGRTGQATSNASVVVEDDNLESREFRSELTKQAIRDAVKHLIPDVAKSMDKMSWTGRIAKIVGSQVYINSGRDSGLVRGDILRVLTAGDDVYDPQSGAYLGKTQGQLKGTLEVVDFIGKDAAVAVTHTGGNAHEGDLVRLY